MSEASDSTVEAVMYELRQDGLAALKVLNCQRRLAELSTKQLNEVISRLIKIRGRWYCPGVTDDLLAALDEMRG